jgi:hypothetical protein
LPQLLRWIDGQPVCRPGEEIHGTEGSDQQEIQNREQVSMHWVFLSSQLWGKCEKKSMHCGCIAGVLWVNSQTIQTKPVSAMVRFVSRAFHGGQNGLLRIFWYIDIAASYTRAEVLLPENDR